MSLDRPGLQSDPSSRGDGDTHLLHQQVDVPLGVVQHVAVGLAQARQRLLHRLAVDVDPAGGAGGQELPVRGAGSPADQACGTAHGRHPSPQHSLVHCVHQGWDPGLASVAQLLTGLPEAEVLGWGPGTKSGPPQAAGRLGAGRQQGGGFSPLNSFPRKSMKWARPTGSSRSSRKLKAHCSTRSLVGTAALVEGR